MQRKYIFGTTITIAVLGAMLVFAGSLKAQNENSLENIMKQAEQAEEKKPEKPLDVEIGTYDPQAAFNGHPIQEELAKSIEQIQAQLQSAGEDQAKQQQLVQQYEQERQNAIKVFERDVEKVLPKVAKDNDIKIVAVQVVYSTEDAGAKNLTADIVKAFSNLKDKGKDEPAPQPESGTPQFQF